MVGSINFGGGLTTEEFESIFQRGESQESDFGGRPLYSISEGGGLRVYTGSELPDRRDARQGFVVSEPGPGQGPTGEEAIRKLAAQGPQWSLPGRGLEEERQAYQENITAAERAEERAWKEFGEAGGIAAASGGIPAALQKERQWDIAWETIGLSKAEKKRFDITAEAPPITLAGKGLTGDPYKRWAAERADRLKEAQAEEKQARANVRKARRGK